MTHQDARAIADNLNEREMLAEIRRQADQVSQKKLAQRIGFSPQYLCDVLQTRREISGALARAFGFERVVSFRQILQSRPAGEGE